MPAEEYRWPCVQCGADLRYAPGETELVCDHCGHKQAVPDAAPRKQAGTFVEHDLARGLSDDLGTTAMEEVRTSSCPSCGAKIEFQGATHATECPFCASPVVVDTGSARLIKPQGVVPFALTEDQARGQMLKWMGSLWFAPSKLLEYARKGRAMNGIYVPYWTFDAATRSRYTGQRGDNYTESRTVTVNVNGRSEQRTEQVTRTNWTPASGRVARRFDDVLVIASTSLPKQLGVGLEPWDLDGMQPYSPDFLAGFQAEGYTVTLDEGNKEAHAIMRRVIEQDVRRDIGGDQQRITSLDTDHSEETFKHILLPVWMAAYKYNGKTYRFLVNGQTGEVQGERPWSVWKIALAVLAVAIIAGVALYLNDPEALGLPRPEWLN